MITTGLLHEFTAASLYILFQGFSKSMIIILKCRFVHDIETPLVYDGVAAKEHVPLQKTGRRIRVNKSREIGVSPYHNVKGSLGSLQCLFQLRLVSNKDNAKNCTIL